MEYERKLPEFPEQTTRCDAVIDTAMTHLIAEMEHLSEAGATARIEALCEVLRVVGGRR